MDAIECRRCGLSKPPADFLFKPDGKPRKPCVACLVKRNREYRHNNPDHVARRNARRRAKTPPRPTAAQRFAKLVAVLNDPDACWVWLASTVGAGYGHFSLAGGRKILAHRFAWEQSKGAIPDGLKVLHRCDNPPCCNPNHLFLGTQADNVHDMMQKGRHRVGNKKGVLS